MVMVQADAKVIKNIEVGPQYYKMVFESSALARSALPGQFIDVKVSDGFEPLLRRPFGIHKAKGISVEILYEVLGQGTLMLSKKKAGEHIEVIGPLGNGFSIRACGNSILVAGGMGVAPLIFLAEKLAEKLREGKRSKSKVKIVVLLGAKTKSHILCEKDFKRLGCEVKIATDDGSRGFKGYVSELLQMYLSSHVLPPSSLVYACGPTPMLQEVSRIATAHALDCQVSLEAHMACGIGACLGCVVRVRSLGSRVRSQFEYQRVCKEGPVFEANQIIWGKE